MYLEVTYFIHGTIRYLIWNTTNCKQTKNCPLIFLITIGS
jgi:hypothetical protein